MMDTYNSWKFNFILLFALKGNISKIVKCFHAKGDFNLNFSNCEISWCKLEMNIFLLTLLMDSLQNTYNKYRSTAGINSDKQYIFCYYYC